MTTNDPRFELIRRCRDGEASTEELAQLDSCLLEDANFRQSYVRYINLNVALSAVAKAMPIPMASMTPSRARRNVWWQWRPLTAAAAGIVFGMLCMSVVYGYAAQRSAVKRTPLPVFDPSFEGMKPLDKGLPHNAGEWGVRSARIVPAENGVRPLQGQRMLRMEPILLGEQDENHYAHAYQVLDLRSLPLDAVSGGMEAQVTASFSAPESEVKARYLIRVVALNEPPATATETFWSKAEYVEVVSLTQRFETEAGDSDWHPFSVKVPLPHGAQSLVIVLAATSSKDETIPAPVRYLDNVQVSFLTSPTIQP